MANREDYAYYMKLWQKSFLVEIVHKETKKAFRTYAFSLPPESFSIEIPQRVNVKKTFGGHFVDDYGIDSMPISIKGSTGNGRYKEIYWDQNTTYVSGKSEAFLILNEIMRYKDGTEDFDKYEMRLYDLSSIETALSGVPVVPETLEVLGWKVVLKSGKIERNKDKPFWYNYELNFIALETIGKKKPPEKVSEYSLNGIEKILAAIDKVKVVTASLKKALAAFKSVMEKLNLVNDILNTLEEEARLFYRTTQGFIDTTTDGVGTVFDVIGFPQDVATDLFQAVRSVRTSIEGVFQTYYNGLSNIETRAEMIASLQKDAFNLEKLAAVVKKEMKSVGSVPDVHVLPGDSEYGTPAIDASTGRPSSSIRFLLTYGDRSVIATSETRLDVLSNNVYGNPDYADLIAKYNGITGDADITPGMVILIPNLNYTTTLRDSEVYTLGEDTLGTDLALSDDGDLELAEYGDYAITTGENNVSQAIVLRLSEDRGARIRVPVYGINDSSGSYDPFTVALLLVSIRETLLQDPRISTVYQFNFQQNVDAAYLNFDIELVNGASTPFTMNV